jgi:hypothetical protein
VAHVLGRYLLHPRDDVWDTILQTLADVAGPAAAAAAATQGTPGAGAGNGTGVRTIGLQARAPSMQAAATLECIPAAPAAAAASTPTTAPTAVYAVDAGANTTSAGNSTAASVANPSNSTAAAITASNDTQPLPPASPVDASSGNGNGSDTHIFVASMMPLEAALRQSFPTYNVTQARTHLPSQRT